MIQTETGWIVLIVLISCILPALLIPITFSIIKYSVDKLPNFPITVILSLSEAIPIGEYLSLYLSMLGVIATVVLAYFIYRLERNNENQAEREEIKRVKRILSVLLETGLQRAFQSQLDDEWEYFDFIRITESHIGLIASIGHLLSEEQFLCLNKIMETLKDIADHEKNGDPGDAKISVKRLMRIITVPVYPMYIFYMKNLRTVYDVMNEQIIEIINIISEKGNKETFSYEAKYDADSNIMFESSPDNRFKIYDKTGKIICDALFDKNGILDGTAKVFCEEGYLEFDGLFVDGKRHGQGSEYMHNGRIGREGEWKEDQLINGIIYDVMLNEKGELFLDSIERAGGPFLLYDLERYSEELKVGNVKIVNCYAANYFIP
ncbi:MAG: hypothetical protein M0P14_03535 [Alkaliphilus sp.]|nr:hypothetical protein [Alkaliphilus sp.]